MLLFMVSRVWEIPSGIGPCLSLAGRFCRWYENGNENLLIISHFLFMRHLQQVLIYPYRSQ
jgi:hypothetical protein